mmetsp:Transcript_25066/g.59204  ORF Transcript_25066/g.59204 Transcript_25066/m.59204 type:complete len:169 (-) Transcript_25066:27-533(-)
MAATRVLPYLRRVPTALSRMNFSSLSSVGGSRFFDPFTELHNLHRGMLRPTEFGRVAEFARCDVVKDGQVAKIDVDLPGVPRENVEIELQNGELSIRGERPEVKAPEDSNDKAVWRLKERFGGKFLRKFSVPKGTTPSDVNAEMSNGVLRVTVDLSSAEPAAHSIPVQ